MKKIFIFPLMLVAVLYFAACENDSPTAPAPNDVDLSAIEVQAELLARELIIQSQWSLDEDAEPPSGQEVPLQRPFHGHLRNLSRETLSGDIVHYSFQAPVGPGEHDVIGIHRVVKETKEFRPIEAENDVDVWGIDQAWTLVPGGTSDLRFMMDWALQRQIDDLEVALMVARFARHLTGNGLAKMLLSGYSSGSATGYAFLNHETQKSLQRRQANGYISVDMAIKTDLPDFAQIWAARAENLLAIRATGVAQDDDVFLLAATLARSAPDGPSPIAPALGLPPEQMLFDFAHVEIFMAEESEGLS